MDLEAGTLGPEGWLLLSQALATCAMAGLIWFVQLVHYPLFAEVGGERFPRYAERHGRLTALVVVPLMCVELFAALALALVPLAGVARWQAWSGAALVAALWLSTALVQAPCHARLRRGFDAAVHRRLVRTNAFRTLAWTARAPLVLAMLVDGALAPTALP